MASGPAFISAISEICGIHHATLVRLFGALRAARLLPISSGHDIAHLDDQDCATIICALCAPTPGGAVDSVAAMKTMIRTAASPNLLSVRPDDQSLWHDLADWVGRFGDEIEQAHEPSDDGPLCLWELTVNLDRSWASIFCPIGDNPEDGDHADYRHQEPDKSVYQHQRRRTFQRMTSVNSLAMETLARLSRRR